MALFRKKSSMPTREEALPGRAEPLKVPATHYVNSHRIVAPFPYQVRGRSRGQGERGKCILPTGVVEFAGDQRLCRWPLELSNWVVTGARIESRSVQRRPANVSRIALSCNREVSSAPAVHSSSGMKSDAGSVVTGVIRLLLSLR